MHGTNTERPDETGIPNFEFPTAESTPSTSASPEATTIKTVEDIQKAVELAEKTARESAEAKAKKAEQIGKSLESEVISMALGNKRLAKASRQDQRTGDGYFNEIISITDEQRATQVKLDTLYSEQKQLEDLKVRLAKLRESDPNNETLIAAETDIPARETENKRQQAILLQKHSDFYRQTEQAGAKHKGFKAEQDETEKDPIAFAIAEVQKGHKIMNDDEHRYAQEHLSDPEKMRRLSENAQYKVETEEKKEEHRDSIQKELGKGAPKLEAIKTNFETKKSEIDGILNTVETALTSEKFKTLLAEKNRATKEANGFFIIEKNRETALQKARTANTKLVDFFKYLDQRVRDAAKSAHELLAESSISQFDSHDVRLDSMNYSYSNGQYNIVNRTQRTIQEYQGITPKEEAAPLVAEAQAFLTSVTTLIGEVKTYHEQTIRKVQQLLEEIRQTQQRSFR